ncbi:MAG: (Fe-S)-binding protein [Pyrobaculum sp.]
MEALKLTPSLLHYFENCQGCSVCAPSCPYYYIDPKYGPVEKAEYLRELMRKRYTVAGRLLGGLAGARGLKDFKDLWDVLKYAYRCADCGHCYVTCPYGIDSGHMVKNLRAVLYRAGVAPSLLKTLSEYERDERYVNSPQVVELWNNFVKTIDAPVGVKGAEVFVTVSLLDVLLTPDVVENTVKILKHVGESFTLPERPLGILPPVSGVVGDTSSLKTTVHNIVSYIEKYSPRKVVFVNGCYTYPYFRFEATNILKKKFLFEVLHISELLDRYIREGRLKFRKLEVSTAYYDSCQLGRRGGVYEEPRRVLKSIVSRYVEFKHSRERTMCLGGGSGIALLSRRVVENLLKIGVGVEIDQKEERFLTELSNDYKAAVEHVLKDIKQVNADVVVVVCPFVMFNLLDNGVKVEHFVNIVASSLVFQ